MRQFMAQAALAFAAVVASTYASSTPVVIQTDSGGQYKLYETSKALIIAQSSYSIWDKLETVPSDAKNIKEALLRHGFDKVDVRTDLKGAALAKAIREFLVQQVKGETRLLLYVASHGWTDGKYTGYIVPTDNELDEQANRFRANLVGIDSISNWSTESKAKHILMVFDSCFSGALFLSRSNVKPPALFLDDANRPVRQFIASGSASQVVPAVSDFSRLFIEGIDGAADVYKDGIVTGYELGYWLKREVTKLNKQTPQYGSSMLLEYKKGDFVFQPDPAKVVAKVSKPVDLTAIVSNMPTSVPQTRSPSKQKTKKNKKTVVSGSVLVAGGGGAPVLEEEDRLPEFLPESPRMNMFTGVDVVYFQKTNDGERVTKALDQQHIPFVRTRAKLPETFATNAIACGPDAPIEAVRTLAHALIDSGIPLRGIIPFAAPASKPSKRIELIHTQYTKGYGLRSSTSLSKKQVDDLQACPEK